MNNDYLHRLRDLELHAASRDFPAPAQDGQALRVLDIGAGTGRQSAKLQEAGYVVTAVDLPSSAYAATRVFPVQDYDGRTLPVPDGHVDVVFSSNVLEHVPHLEALLAETLRVLSPDGVAIHILPTAAWRTWTTLTHFPWVLKRLFQVTLARRRRQVGAEGPALPSDAWGAVWPSRHGERGNIVTEAWYFSEQWWKRAFRNAGFEVVESRPAGIFYSGSILFGERLGNGVRRQLARWLGSSCRIYVLRPASRGNSCQTRRPTMSMTK